MQFGSLFLLPGQGFVFVSVSLRPFKTHLKVELLFLEGIERVLIEGLEVQEETIFGWWPRRWGENETKNKDDIV